MDNALEETTFSLSPDAPPRPERRAAPRHMTILRVGTLIANGQRELCLVRNISAGGLMAHVYSLFTEGQQLQIELRPDQPIAGQVNWVSESNIGISFDEAIDVEEMLATQSVENGRRPRLPRVEVDRMATLRSGARTFWVGTRDISQGGIKVETDRTFSIGEQVVLSLDGLPPIPGVVRWSHNGHSGIAFNQVVPFRDLMQWLRSDGGSPASVSAG